MPKHKVHRYVDRLMFGKSFGDVHRAIDFPYVFLGRKHRRMFHTPVEAYVVGSSSSLDRRGGLSGLWHVWVDEQCSKDKAFRMWLQFSAEQDAARAKILRQLAKLRKKRRRRHAN